MTIKKKKDYDKWTGAKLKRLRGGDTSKETKRDSLFKNLSSTSSLEIKIEI